MDQLQIKDDTNVYKMEQQLYHQIRNKHIKYSQIPEEYKNNLYIIIEALKLDAFNVIRLISKIFLCNYDVILAAVSNNGMVLEYIFDFEIDFKHSFDVINGECYIERIIINDERENFINNYDIVMMAVTQNGLALHFASDRLRYNYDIVLTAVKQNGFAIRYADTNFLKDYNIVLAAVTQNGLVLECIFRFEIDFEYIYEDDYQNGEYYRYCIERIIINADRQDLINNFHIVMMAVSQNGLALEFASSILQNNYDIVLAAVSNNGLAIKFAIYEEDKIISITAILNDSKAVNYIPYSLRLQIKEIIHNATIKNMDYFYNKIKDNTLLPCAELWLYLIPDKHTELQQWIKQNIYTYESLFRVLYYKCNIFNNIKKLGYFKPVEKLLLSYLQEEHYEILKDIYEVL